MADQTLCFDVVVVGAGAVGAACALRLSQQQPTARIAIIEHGRARVRDTSNNDRVWALGAAAMSLIDDAGIASQLNEQHCYPYHKMVVWDEYSDGELSFAAQELGLTELGFMTDADQITALLHEALIGAANITELFENSVVDVNFDADLVQLKLANEKSIETKLLIAADGGQSWLRRQAKIAAPSKSYQQKGIVARITTEASHEDTAWQRFLPSGPVAVLPLAQNYSSIVWSTEENQAQNLVACSAAEFETELGLALEHRLGSVKLAGKRFAFPLQSRQAESYRAERLVLIGDAAHSIHPLAGQGANLGFQDVAALVDILQHAQDFGANEHLARYQRIRRPQNLQTDFLMNGLHHAYRINHPLWSLLRGRGMNLISGSPLIKSWLARRAIG